MAFILPKWSGRLAFHILCKVRNVPVTNKGNTFLDTAKENKIYHDGYEATIYTYGNGSKNILFLHGWLSNSERWRKTLEAIDLTIYTCYLMDAPGHGRSKGDHLNLEVYKIFLLELVESLNGVHAIVGHSLGSLVSAYAFLENPNLPVDKFVLTGAPEGMTSIFDFFKRITNFNHKVIDQLNNYINRNVTSIPSKEINISNFLKKVHQPVLIIHDFDDKICPITAIQTAVAHNKEVNTFFTSGLAHDLDDKCVIDATINFLNTP